MCHVRFPTTYYFAIERRARPFHDGHQVFHWCFGAKYARKQGKISKMALFSGNT
jgi:hypothetical protein